MGDYALVSVFGIELKAGKYVGEGLEGSLAPLKSSCSDTYSTVSYS
jgi:hypothetical protein